MKNKHLFMAILCVAGLQILQAQQIDTITGPAGSQSFGNNITFLSNGNYVVVDEGYDEGAVPNVGAVYLYNGLNNTLISTLKGSTAFDNVGNGGITELSNGNYVVNSSIWNNGTATRAGAVTWGDGSTGTSGIVSSSNSLVGSKANDNVGNNGDITALSNGNYVVNSPNWDNGSIQNAGAVTWGNGGTGTSGILSSSNSLVGSVANDFVGGNGVTALSNGNYVVCSENWANGSILNAGAVTWGNGSKGTSGTLSSSNSLVGNTADDNIGGKGITALGNTDDDSYRGKDITILSNGNYVVSSNGITALSNGNYVVSSPNWDDGSILNAGAVTWGNGSTGTSGILSSSNSLVGSKANDNVGNNGDITALSNGNYVVNSPNWDNGSIQNAGAVTWGNGGTGTSGILSSSNSLVGSKANDFIGSNGVTALSNGNYVVSSTGWDNGIIAVAGAVTWGNGSKGTSGILSSSNSLVGSTANDNVGNGGVTALSNGNYVVSSWSWDNGTTSHAGAVTWGNGSTGTSGTVSSSNSLVGSKAFDLVGFDGVTALSNGNYVVISREWDNGIISDAGAVTWGNGSKGTSGTLSSSNSLVGSSSNSSVGSTANDNVGNFGVTALSNGNYVVISGNWDNGIISDAGAVTWGNGSTGTSGTVSSSNSLVGSRANDRVGSDGVTALSNGNYVVSSRRWDNGSILDAGAVTWGNGSTGTSGTVSSSNSLVGSTNWDFVGVSGVTALSNGNYVVSSTVWDNGSILDVGAVTWGNGSTGISGTVSSSNSLVGSTADDQVGLPLATPLNNGGYIAHAAYWDNGSITDAGALKVSCDGTAITGLMGTNPDLAGTATNEQLSGTNSPTNALNAVYGSVIIKSNGNKFYVYSCSP